jgi:hypothetical protein
MDLKVTGVVADPTISGYQANFLTEIISPLLGLATSIAFVLFLAGVIRFFVSKANGNPDEIEKGRNHMLWGIVALFVLVSVWSILKFIGGSFNSSFWFVK